MSNIAIGIYFLEPVNGKQMTAIPCAYLANEAELTKAVIEAAFLANPKVEIDKQYIAAYGQPPYGIFRV